MNDNLLIHLHRPSRFPAAVWESIRQAITFDVIDDLAGHGIASSYQNGQLFDLGFEPEVHESTTDSGAA